MNSERGAGEPTPGRTQPSDLLEAAAIGIARLGSDGRLTDANPRTLEILGRDARALARTHWDDLAHPHESAHIHALLQEMWSGERAELQVEQRVLRPDGSWLWVSVAVSPLRDAAGRVDSLVVGLQDITAQKLIDEALRHSELRFRRLIEKLPAGAYTCDRDGLITYYNDRAVQLWGRAPKLHHPDDRYCGSFKLYTADGSPIAHERCWMARALREARDFDAEEVHIERPDGSRVAVLAHASPLRDECGEIVGSLNILVDITDRKQAELMLLGSELRFTQFMENLRGLAWIKDFEGRYLFINAAAGQALARQPTSFVGRTDEEIFPSEAAAQFRENDRKVLATGTACETIEALELADGLHHWMVSKFPIPGPDGSSTRVGGIAIDVTESVRSREALLDADRRKDHFLAALAHELRNPLAPIRSSLQVLRETTDAPHVCAMLERQVGQMVRLVDDLLEVSRITRGRVELRRQRVELSTVLRTALETSRPALEAGRHAFELSLPDEPLFVDADPVRLAQVFVNLLDNAAKYTPDGGHIALGAERAGDEMRVWVRDDGVGIPRHVLPRVFEPFTQVSHTLPRAAGGLGIGLALVAQLVDLHGGSISAHSEGSGRGSEFVVTLPLVVSDLLPRSGAARGPSAPHRAARPLAPGHRVLVVDDNRDAAESLALLLRTRGVDAVVAHDGPEALENARTRAPTVVLLDLGMPGMDGFEVARRLRADVAVRDALLVALTGWGQADVQSRCQAAGFDRHLVKPVSLEALEALLALPPRSEAAHS